jgi:Tol biopolymer transport system component
MLDIRRGDLHAIMPSTVAESQPAVSPDGHRIAFASGDLDFDIVEIALDGESVRSVLATSMKETAPAWSPSGAQYAYSTNGNGHWQIWLRNAREEGATPLASHDASQTIYDIENLKFSPDGRRIAYDLYGARHSVAISNLAGGAPMILDPQNPDNHGPSWSPDGNWIAYRRVVDGKWELVKRSVGGGESIHLDDTGEGGRPTAWSPSGEWICHLLPGSGLRLVSQNGARRLDIQSGGASAFGSQDGARRLEIQSGGTAAFGFSTDSRTLYAVRANSSRHWELAAFPLPAGAPAKIMPLDLPGGAAVSGFTMNPDGKSFLTAVGKARLDIWLLEGFAQP